MELADQSVLIPGGTSGIGLACARAFVAAGAKVCIVGRNTERGAAAAAELGPRASFIAADCAEPGQVERMVAEAAAQMGRIDTLVCSLGANFLPQLLFRQSLDDIQASLNQDLAPFLYVGRAVLPVMMAQNSGSVINIASDAGKIATPGESVIGASMAAIIQFTRGLAIEAKRNGIRANTITPSLVEGTPLTDRLLAEGTFAAKLFAKARPLAHLGPTTPNDLAALAIFLASPASARITGQAISVNGGISTN
ncbi:MAG TPA: SDR family NAD(P)-dependent oxidoreductase [Thermohalobaculum sp.]|nr:SDR family NAD(P)-dependent oxidoreductase [Thermohalobaculum sp.]